MKYTIETKINDVQGSITGIDYDEISKDQWLRNEMLRLAVLAMTHRTKLKLIADGRLNYTFDELKSIWLTGGGSSIPVSFIDEALKDLESKGAKIGKRPLKAKGQDGGESPTTWAQNIELHPKIGAHYTKVGKQWGATGRTIETLADYAQLLEWRHHDLARQQAEELQADFSDLDDDEESA